IAGNSTQGQTLTASNTLADADGLGAISYQWLRAGTPIVGATQSNYILGQSDVGKAISVQANYVDLLGAAESVQSTQTSVIAPKANSLPIGNVNISGTPTQGQTLFASNNLSDADGLGAINYQWLRAGTVISGATQSNYTLTQADVSKSITVKASYTDLTGVAESVTSSATLSIANVNDLPIGVVSINGLAKTGQTLTASNNLSDADGLGSMSYQWLRSGYVISGANQSSYILTSNDVNSTISVKASYTDGFGAQEAVTSSATAIITSSNNAPTGYPTASLTNGAKNTTYTVYAVNLLQGFSDADGDVLSVTNLSATNGSISNNGNNTWTLTPNTNFVGTISLYYNVTDSKSTPLSASQSLTINQGQVPPTGSVFINGTPQQNQTLTAGNALADANGLGTINYQWLSNGYVMSGANQNFYTLTQAEVGKTISVTASYTDGLGKLESVSSYSTYSVSNVNDLPKGSVYITGKPNQGQVLTASNELSDLDGLGVIYYQWLRYGYTINYANQSSYTLTANDANSTISVKASYQDNFGTNESVVSSSITALPPINRPPVGAAQSNNSGVEDNNYTLYSGFLLNGFSDPDGDLLSVTNLSATHGKIATNSDGAWLLTPDQNFNGTVQFNYSVTDNKGGSINATLNFSLSPVNDLPTGAVTIVGEPNQGKVLTTTNTISDVDGLGAISYQWLRYGAMINGANQSTYTLTSNDVNAYISVKASYIDGNGTTESMSSSGVTGLPP
ncbi:MAG: cadherin-like domain-containing protein, partial [Methylococcales bacterium]